MIRWRAWLQLARVPNLMTSAADVTAGFLIAGGSALQWQSLALLAAASMCFYAGGVVLNDVFDAPRDAAERPNRPIPSGAVARRHAAAFGVSLLVAGLGLSMLAGGDAGWIGLLLATFIVLYDGVLKATPLAPGLMGLCRSLNLLLGMCAAPVWDVSTAAFTASLMWLYVASLTFFARREAAISTRARLTVGLTGVCMAVAGQSAIGLAVGYSSLAHLLAICILCGLLLVVGTRAVRTCAKTEVQNAVRSFVLAIVLFDACLVIAVRESISATAVVAWLAPAIILSRRFKVT